VFPQICTPSSQAGLFMAKRKASEIDDRRAKKGVSARTLEQRILSAVSSQDADSLDAAAFQIVSPVRGKGLSADEVGFRFWWDPAACLRNLNARDVVRNRTVGERPWLSTDVAARALKKRGLRAEEIKSGITKILEQWQLPWWQALKNAVVSKDAPPGIAERIADLLAGFALARSVVGPESNAAQMWFHRTGKWLGRRKTTKDRRTVRMLFTDVCALIACELRPMNLGGTDTASLISDLFGLVGWEAMASSIERNLRRVTEKRTHRNK
jgi:hypothetical protein